MCSHSRFTWHSLSAHHQLSPRLQHSSSRRWEVKVLLLLSMSFYTLALDLGSFQQTFRKSLTHVLEPYPEKKVTIVVPTETRGKTAEYLLRSPINLSSTKYLVTPKPRLGLHGKSFYVTDRRCGRLILRRWVSDSLEILVSRVDLPLCLPRLPGFSQIDGG